MKKISTLFLSLTLAMALACPASAVSTEENNAAGFIKERGIMVGDQNGEMNLSSGLTRAQLAVVLTRLSGKQENVQAEEAFYTSQCTFSDVPEWARAYVGYCFANGLMVGYDAEIFGSGDGVTPAAACTVVLRYMAIPDTEWDYANAVQTALSMDLITAEASTRNEVTRGDLAIMLYRVLSDENPESGGVKPAVTISSYKGTELRVGERSGLMISLAGTVHTVVSRDPAVLDVEQVAGNWVAAAKAPGTVTITAVGSNGAKGELTLQVIGDGGTTAGSSDGSATAFDSNMEVREEIIRLVNQVRREHGVPYLTVNDALMGAAQECSDRQYTWHHTKEECESVLAHGYPHGFGNNLTVFTGAATEEIARCAVDNWVDSPGHFKAMIDPDGDTIGVGVTRTQNATYCYMFVGKPNSINPYG